MSRSVVPTAATSAIYGDANTQQATYLPDLNSLQNDPFLNISSSSERLGIFQQLNIKDNIYDTKTEIQYPTITTPGNTVFQFNLMGWASAREMCIEIPIEIKLSRELLSGSIKLDAGKNYPAVNSTMYQALQWAMPNFTLLTFIQRFEIYMGNNNQQIGKQQQWSTIGLKTCATDMKYDENMMDYIGLLGLPISQIFAMTQEQYGGSSSGCQNVDDRIKRAWLRLFELGNVGVSANGFNALPGTTLNIRLPIPLALLSYFFKSDTYLPPGLKFKFDIGYDSNTNIIATSGDCATLTAEPSQVVTAKILSSQQWRFCYFNHTLRQPLQQQVNLKWVNTPFLYNYETSEYYETVGDNFSSTYYQNIAVSQQRPTQLLFGIYSNNPNVYYSSTPADTTVPDFTRIAQQQWQLPGATYSTAATNSTSFPGVFQNMCWPRSLVNHPGVKRIVVTIAGRSNYYYENNKQFFDTAAPSAKGQAYYLSPVQTAQDYIFSEASRKTYMKYNTDGGVDTNLNQFQWGAMGSLATLTLAPGNDVDRGVIPSDQGAHTIRVEIEFAAPLTTNMKLVIFKKMPEQIALDSSQNCTMIMWPAVKSNTGYIIPSSTVVAQ